MPSAVPLYQRNVGIQPGTVQEAFGQRALAGVTEKIGGALEQVGQTLEKEQAGKVERQSAISGAQAGATTDPSQLQLPTGDSIAEEAYRRSAVQAAGSQVKLQARDDAMRLAQASGGDPEAYRANLKAAASGFAGKLPPDLQGQALEAYDFYGQRNYADLDEKKRAFVKDQNLAAITGEIETTSNDAANLARKGDVDGARALTESLNQSLTKAGPVQVGGSGALSLTQITEASAKLRDSIGGEFIRGVIDRAPDKEGLLKGLQSGRTGDERVDALNAQLDPKARDQLLGKLEVQVREEQVERRRQQEAQERLAEQKRQFGVLELKDRVQDEIAKREAGVPVKEGLTRNDFAALAGKSGGPELQRLYNDYQGKRDTADALGLIGNMPLQQQEAYLADLKGKLTPDTPNFADKAATLKALEVRVKQERAEAAPAIEQARQEKIADFQQQLDNDIALRTDGKADTAPPKLEDFYARFGDKHRGEARREYYSYQQRLAVATGTAAATVPEGRRDEVLSALKPDADSPAYATQDAAYEAAVKQVKAQRAEEAPAREEQRKLAEVQLGDRIDNDLARREDGKAGKPLSLTDFAAVYGADKKAEALKAYKDYADKATAANATSLAKGTGESRRDELLAGLKPDADSPAYADQKEAYQAALAQVKRDRADEAPVREEQRKAAVGRLGQAVDDDLAKRGDGVAGKPLTIRDFAEAYGPEKQAEALNAFNEYASKATAAGAAGLAKGAGEGRRDALLQGLKPDPGSPAYATQKEAYEAAAKQVASDRAKEAPAREEARQEGLIALAKAADNDVARREAGEDPGAGLSLGDFARAFGPGHRDDGIRAFNDYKEKRLKAAATAAGGTATPAEAPAIAAALDPQAVADDYAINRKALLAFTNAKETSDKRLREDPAFDARRSNQQVAAVAGAATQAYQAAEAEQDPGKRAAALTQAGQLRAKAIALSLAEQRRRGLPDEELAPLAKQDASDAVGAFKRATSADERLAVLTPLTLGLRAEDGQPDFRLARKTLDQLERAGLPKGADRALEALQGGNPEAAKDILTALTLDAKALPANDVKGKDLTAAVNAAYAELGPARAEASTFAVSGQPGNGNTFTGGRDLVTLLAKAEIAKNPNLDADAAVKLATTKAFAGQRAAGSDDLGVVKVDQGVDPDRFTAGLAALREQADLTHYEPTRDRIAATLPPGTPEGVIQGRLAAAKRDHDAWGDDVKEYSKFVSVPGGYSLVLGGSGALAGPDGKPRIFTSDEVLGAAGQPRPGVLSRLFGAGPAAAAETVPNPLSPREQANAAAVREMDVQAGRPPPPDPAIDTEAFGAGIF